MSTGGGHHNARALLADAGKGVEVETGEILFICFGAILAVGMMIGVGSFVAYGGATQTTKLTFPGRKITCLARTNEREKMDQDDWCQI